MTQESERLERLTAELSASHQDAIASRREVVRLKREVERLEAWEGQAIDERDLRCRQLEEVAETLGLDVEWSNLCDVGDEAIEGAQAAAQRAEEAEATLGAFIRLSSANQEAFPHVWDEPCDGPGSDCEKCATGVEYAAELARLEAALVVADEPYEGDW